LKNDGVNSYDVLGLWKKDKTINNDRRRIYLKEAGDSYQDLAALVGLDIDEIHKWAKLVNGDHCKVSVPNIWISADFLRGGGVYSRLVNLGGTVGRFIGTDLLTYGFKIEKPDTIQQLFSALSVNQKDVWGMVVFGHGNKEGQLSSSMRPQKHGIDWIFQSEIFPYVDKNGYRLSQVYMMQCFSSYKGFVEVENPPGQNSFYTVDHASEWKKRVVEGGFFGYQGVNVCGWDND
jgi:hypothetical protein